MSILDRLGHVFGDLGLIFVACVPLYFLINWLDVYSAKLSARFMDTFFTNLDERMTKLKDAERSRWAAQGRNFRKDNK